MNNPHLKLCQRLEYTFKDEELLVLALTHRSKGSRNNERLEYLGDSIVNFVIANQLFHQFPEAKEGKLSRLRAQMVKGKTLASIARDFDLGDFLILGSGELKSGGHRRESILADAVEAIIGAIYLDSGMAQVETCILSWFKNRLAALTLEDPIKDPKTRLQEYQQAQHLGLPKYEVIDLQGPTNEQVFTVTCSLPQIDQIIQATGSSRRSAEQASAILALAKLDIEYEGMRND